VAIGPADAVGGMVRRLFQLARMPLLALARPRAWAMQAGRGDRLRGASCRIVDPAALLGAFGCGLIAGCSLRC
jgi:putative ABC transport system permease protein